MNITTIDQLKHFYYTINGVHYSLYDYLVQHGDSNTWWYGTDVQRYMRISRSTLIRRRNAFLYPSVQFNGTHYYPSIFFTKIMLLQTFYQE